MPDEMVSKYDLHNLDKRLSQEIYKLRECINENAANIAELNVKYNNLADLPRTINNLNNTLTVVSERLESMNTNMKSIRESVDEQRQLVHNLKEENNHQNAAIEEIDNKSKIDWAKAITENFWKIVIIIGVFYAMFKDIL